MKAKQLNDFYQYLASKLEMETEQLLTYTPSQIKAELEKEGLDLETIKDEFTSPNILNDISHVIAWVGNFTFNEKNAVIDKIGNEFETLLNGEAISFPLGDRNISVKIDDDTLFIVANPPL